MTQKVDVDLVAMSAKRLKELICQQLALPADFAERGRDREFLMMLAQAIRDDRSAKKSDIIEKQLS